jgi:hypothetical protein
MLLSPKGAPIIGFDAVRLVLLNFSSYALPYDEVLYLVSACSFKASAEARGAFVAAPCAGTLVRV